MGFLALIMALVLEQIRPLPRGNWGYQAYDKLQNFVHQNTQTGERRMARFAWWAVMGVALVVCLLIEWLAAKIHPMVLFAVHVLALYLTVGFRQFSHAFSEIQLALAANDVDAAKGILEGWLRRSNPEFNAPRGVGAAERSETCRLAISHAMLDSHRYVLAPLLWYVLLPGFVGPVLYRCAAYLCRQWDSVAGKAQSPDHAEIASIGYSFVDWIPARLSAAAFAVVGNFEDAVYCWRRAASNLPEEPLLAQQSLILSAGSGALGYRIYDNQLAGLWNDSEASSAADPSVVGDETFDWEGAAPDAPALRSAVGLVWRTVVLWIGMFGMLTAAGWLGGLA